jgi:DNA polymerase
MPSLFQVHVDTWKNCTNCPLHETRRHIVLYRASVPCQLLVIGEAPGPSEDMLGKPFIGPAGKELDKLLRIAGYEGIAIGYTNLVACIPIAEDGGFMEPPDESIVECAPRLFEIIRIAKPKVILMAGEIAQTWIPEVLKKMKLDIPTVGIIHPGAILRMKQPQKNMALDRSVAILEDLREEHFPA